MRREGQGFTPNDARLDARRPEPARACWSSPARTWPARAPICARSRCSPFWRRRARYVPARKLRLGIVDRVFARVGASDDLARGRSTFMTEMVETAAILHQAGPRSLVVLDEIGRGTATFDGLAIAWAVAEHLHEVNSCRAVFATHYHELTRLRRQARGRRQRASARQGVEGRSRLPARSRARRRRSLLRHPGRQARRPAQERGRARPRRAGAARGQWRLDARGDRRRTAAVRAGDGRDSAISAGSSARAEINPDSLSPKAGAGGALPAQALSTRLAGRLRQDRAEQLAIAVVRPLSRASSIAGAGDHVVADRAAPSRSAPAWS